MALAHDADEPSTRREGHVFHWSAVLLAQLADVLLIAQPLGSGISREIHGQLTIRLRDNSGPAKIAQFRVNDNGATFFPKGTAVQ